MNIQAIFPLNQMLHATTALFVEDPSLPFMVLLKTDKDADLKTERVIEENSNQEEINLLRKSFKAILTPHTGDRLVHPESTTDSPVKSHLVLRFRYEDDQLTLIHSAVIDGPFESNPHLHANGLAFEALLGNTKLYFGSIADYQHKQRFADPNGGPERQGHVFGTLGSVDLQVRLPIEELNFESLQKLQINIYRVKAAVDVLDAHRSVTFAAEPFQQQLHLVYAMNGVDLRPLGVGEVELLRKHLTNINNVRRTSRSNSFTYQVFCRVRKAVLGTSWFPEI